MGKPYVLIVGAGIAGASLAAQLAQAGRRVTLLEREAQPGYHSTGRSAAMFMESYGPPGVRALTRAGRAFYLQPPEGFADAPILSPRRALFVATAQQRASLSALGDTLAAAGTHLTLLNQELLALAAPALKADLFAEALLDEQGFDINVHALHQGYLRRARQQGAELRLGTTVLSATQNGAGWRVALSDGSSWHGEVIVNAAGAWADEVAALCGVAPIGIEPRRRSAFTFNPPQGADVRDWAMVCDVDEEWYYKPDAGQLLGSPANADPVPPHDVQPEEFDIALGIHRLQEATTFEIRRPTATWAGLRSFAPDGEIVIGFDDAAPGFFWLAAQGGYGIQSAAGASRLAASLIDATPLPDELLRHGVEASVVAPGRFRVLA